MEAFSFAKYFGDINILADLQFMPGDKPYLDRPSATRTEGLAALPRLQCATNRPSSEDRDRCPQGDGVRLQHGRGPGSLLRNRPLSTQRSEGCPDRRR